MEQPGLPSRYASDIQTGGADEGKFPFRDIPLMSKPKLGIREGARVGAFKYGADYSKLMQSLIRGDMFQV